MTFPGNVRNALASMQGLQAAGLMLLSCVIFSFMTAVIRRASDELPAIEVVFFRNFFGLITLAPFILRNGIERLDVRRTWLYAARAGSGYFSMVCWFSAIALVPLSDAVALAFTGPLFITVLAILVLGEHVGLRRWTATLIGFGGAILILRPGFEAFNFDYFLVLGSAAGMAVSVILIKVLGRTEAATSIVTYMVLFITPISLVPALFVWQWPTPIEFLWLFALGGLATLGHLAITRALVLAEATAVMPLDFARLPITALIAYFWFGEPADPLVWVGAGVIFSSALYIAQREARLKKVPQDRAVAQSLVARADPDAT
ncbi:MAG: DMT family transporter [Alphaproteobacteria bacterium]|nr:DMT family transporter [Alphaproteobacteria bacterium]